MLKANPFFGESVRDLRQCRGAPRPCSPASELQQGFERLLERCHATLSGDGDAKPISRALEKTLERVSRAESGEGGTDQ